MELIAYQPWRKGERDGCYQVLAVERPKDNLSPELKEVVSKVLRKLEPEHAKP